MVNWYYKDDPQFWATIIDLSPLLLPMRSELFSRAQTSSQNDSTKVHPVSIRWWFGRGRLGTNLTFSIICTKRLPSLLNPRPQL